MITQKGMEVKLMMLWLCKKMNMNIMQSLSLTFSINDMRIKTVQSSISTLQFRNKMQSFTKCTKIMINIQKTKNAKQCKMPIFLYFQYTKKKMHGLIRNLIYKILLCIKEIT